MISCILSKYESIPSPPYTLAAAALANGDAIEITTSIVVAGTNAAHTASIYVNSTAMGSFGAAGTAVPRYFIRVVMTRVSATTMFVEYNYKLMGANTAWVAESGSVTASVTVNNLDSLTNAISVRGNSPAGTTMQSNFLMIKLLKL